MLHAQPQRRPGAPHKKRPSFMWRRFAMPLYQSIAAFLLSFAQLFGIPSPFALTLTAALGLQGESTLAALLGLGAATGMRYLWRLPGDPWPLVGGLILTIGRKFYFNCGQRRAYAWTALSLLPRVLYTLIASSPADVMLSAASLALGVASLFAFNQSLCLIKTPKDALAWDDKLCLGLCLALLLCAMGYLHLFGINLGLMACCVLCLSLGYASGSDTAALAGLLCGTSMALGGHGAHPIFLLCSAGLIAGLLRRFESRLKCAVAFSLTLGLAAVIVRSDSLLYDAAAALIASLAFLAIPPARFTRLDALVKQIHQPAAAGENSYASDMLRQWEDAIEEMSRSLPTLDDVDQATWKRLNSCLCQGCERYAECWGEENDAVLPRQLWDAAQENPESMKAWAAASGCDCPRLHQAFDAVAHSYAQEEADQLRLGRARLEQAMIRTHLDAMAHAVRRLSVASQGESLSDLKGMATIERILKDTGFPAHLLYVRRPGGRLQCLLESDTPAFTRWQPQRLISDLWTHGGLSMEITQLEKSRMHLEETPVFRLETGSATLGMEEDNGDGLLTMRLPGGRYLLALSDGMGHGSAACRQSQETLNLLRLCLTAGYTRRQAITAVNGMMLSATGGSSFATMDLWTIDLWSGLAQVDKLGACQSCLWRGDKLRFIEGAALPLGILEEVAPQSCQFRLSDNDLLLVFSDGIADAFSSQEELSAAVARSVYQDPQRTADAFLRCALISGGGIPNDDMTVLAVRITQWAAPAGIASSTPS